MARSQLYQLVREELGQRAYFEVETPCLLSAPGLEPHLTAFEASFRPEMPGLDRRKVYLQTSPEYAMKRLLAEGFGHVFQICKAFRNGEAAARHNPEFAMLEFYRSPGTAEDIRADLEALIQLAARELGPAVRVDLTQTFDRLTVREAFLRIDLDLAKLRDGPSLLAAATAKGHRFDRACRSFEDVFFQIFLNAIEPTLGVTRPTYLTEYPASMAALARLLPGDPPVADRFELYAGGMELANGFGELNDEPEQRRRLLAEQAQRRTAGRPVYPLDERFLAAVGKMPPSGGVAVGLDRLLMLLLGIERIEDVLLFPAMREWA
jgi:lysyl-tRNA synthetase class 2